MSIISIISGFFPFYLVIRTRCLSRITGASRRGGNATVAPRSAEHDTTFLARPFKRYTFSFFLPCIPV